MIGAGCVAQADKSAMPTTEESAERRVATCEEWVGVVEVGLGPNKLTRRSAGVLAGLNYLMLSSLNRVLGAIIEKDGHACPRASFPSHSGERMSKTPEHKGHADQDPKDAPTADHLRKLSIDDLEKVAGGSRAPSIEG